MKLILTLKRIKSDWIELEWGVYGEFDRERYLENNVIMEESVVSYLEFTCLTFEYGFLQQWWFVETDPWNWSGRRRRKKKRIYPGWINPESLSTHACLFPPWPNHWGIQLFFFTTSSVFFSWGPFFTTWTCLYIFWIIYPWSSYSRCYTRIQTTFYQFLSQSQCFCRNKLLIDKRSHKVKNTKEKFHTHPLTLSYILCLIY